MCTAFSVLGPPCWGLNPVASHGAVHAPLKPRPLCDTPLLSPSPTSHIPTTGLYACLLMEMWEQCGKNKNNSLCPQSLKSDEGGWEISK